MIGFTINTQALYGYKDMLNPFTNIFFFEFNKKIICVIGYLAILVPYKGKGYGSKIMNLLIEKCHQIIVLVDMCPEFWNKFGAIDGIDDDIYQYMKNYMDIHNFEDNRTINGLQSDKNLSVYDYDAMKKCGFNMSFFAYPHFEHICQFQVSTKNIIMPNFFCVVLFLDIGSKKYLLVNWKENEINIKFTREIVIEMLKTKISFDDYELIFPSIDKDTIKIFLSVMYNKDFQKFLQHSNSIWQNIINS